MRDLQDSNRGGQKRRSRVTAYAICTENEANAKRLRRYSLA